jgi:hypothetical protein
MSRHIPTQHNNKGGKNRSTFNGGRTSLKYSIAPSKEDILIDYTKIGALEQNLN